MALLPNSSLHNWISFNETAWNNASFPSCQHVRWTLPNGEDQPVRNITNASCMEVCNDSVSLFGWQENLATCGLWSTLVYAYNYDGPGLDSSRYTERAPVDLLNSFADVGLDADDPEYFQSAVGYADIMSACFVYLYQLTQRDGGFVSGFCTKNGLFPYSPWSGFYRPNGSVDANFNHSATMLSICLVEMCSPVALNPELAGVGVSISNIMNMKSIDLTLDTSSLYRSFYSLSSLFWPSPSFLVSKACICIGRTRSLTLRWSVSTGHNATFQAPSKLPH